MQNISFHMSSGDKYFVIEFSFSFRDTRYKMNPYIYSIAFNAAQVRFVRISFIKNRFCRLYHVIHKSLSKCSVSIRSYYDKFYRSLWKNIKVY